MWFDKGHVVINSLKLIFHVANSRNVDLTEKTALNASAILKISIISFGG